MQATLFGSLEPAFDRRLKSVQREELGRGAWLEWAPFWLLGHERLFQTLKQAAEWHSQQRQMYERIVEVPRLMARAPVDGEAASIIGAMSLVLSERYRRNLDQVTLAWYRDGRDSVALHGDRMGPLVDDTVIAILSLGAPRRFILKPAISTGGKASDSSTRFYRPGMGDLMVMGGSCQRSFLHGVPKQASAGPRLAIMFRERVP